MKAKIHVTLKKGVLDPQGKAIGHALRAMGFEEFGEVRQRKYIEIDLKNMNESTARHYAEAMCDKLLANTVVESYDVDIEA